MAMAIGLVWLPGCATGRVFNEFIQTSVNRQETKQYDQRMYRARSLYRHRVVLPIPEGEQAVVLDESNPAAEIFDSRGYKQGLEAVFLNDSTRRLRVDVTDPHGQLFTFWLEPAKDIKLEALVANPLDKNDTVRVSGGQVLKLEAGRHVVSAYRAHDREAWATSVMSVYSDRVYHPQGMYYCLDETTPDLIRIEELGHYFGGRRFFGN